jgi:predicted MFS family arabinose efflux permease
MNSMSNALKSLVILFRVSDDWVDFTKACLATSLYFGALIGSLLTLVTIRFSSRQAIIILDCLLIVGSAFEMSENLYIFLIGRVIAGIGAGMHSIIVPLFIKMLSPK